MRKIDTLKRILKNDEMILIDSSFDVLSLLDIDKSYNANEYDMNLLVGKRNVYIICEVLFYPFIKDIKNIKVIKCNSNKYLYNSKTFIHDVNIILQKEKIKRLGLVNMSFSHYYDNIVTFGFISPLKTLGIVKSENEIKKIKNCAVIMKNIIKEIPEYLKIGITDIKLRNVIDEMIYKMGAERRFVPTLVGFNSKTIYPTLIGAKLKKDDIILIDFGVMNRGIGISISHSQILNGSTSKTRLKHLKIVSDALEVMRSIVKEGINVCDIDMEMRDFFTQHKLEKYFIDYAVKLPGTSFFEEVNSIKERTTLFKNSIIKLSSSLFIPDKYGLRCESIVHVKKKGCNVIL
ncbi:aminopeptidase P family protein [candidate division WOR-3 bacterium]|nr:aminopeptidase P family protein [candidate division WOR-3 bacterium]